MDGRIEREGKRREGEIGSSIWILPFNIHPLARSLAHTPARVPLPLRALSPTKNFNRKIMSHLIART